MRPVSLAIIIHGDLQEAMVKFRMCLALTKNSHIMIKWIPKIADIYCSPIMTNIPKALVIFLQLSCDDISVKSKLACVVFIRFAE